MNKTALFIAFALLSSSFSIADGKADVFERQKIFNEIKNTFQDMGKMMKKPENYKAEAFNTMSIRLNDLAKQPWEHFTEASRTEKSDTKEEAWTQEKNFKQAIQQFQNNTARLQKAAAGNDINYIRAPFAGVAENCKSCHNGFKTGR